MREAMATWLRLGMMVGAIAFASPALAVKVINVDSTADEFDDDLGDSICHTASGHCTLRAAVQQAVNNNASVTDAIKIIVPAGVYTLTIPHADGGGVLYLDQALNGSPLIEIDGAGVNDTIIDANHIDRAFRIGNRHALLSGMTIRNGSSLAAGAAIANLGDLAIDHVSIVSNDTDNFGGGICNFTNAALTINASTIAYNNARQGGGGIYTSSALSVIIVNSTIAANTTTASGGGIGNDGTAAINVYNTTIAYNDADHTRETGELGGGISSDISKGGKFNLYNSVVANNTVSNTPLEDDCFGSVSTHARNRFGSTENCTITQVSGSYALLSPNVLGDLQDNGGPTLTIALPAGSNAINAGDPTFGCLDINGTTILTDQRGFTRNAGICDLGSYELGALDPSDRVFADSFEFVPPPVH